MMDVVLPWRYYVSEALQNNYLPLWNPYQQMGYPLYADLQYPFWYVEQLIIGYTIGYNNYTLHFLFIFYIWLGGCGMYRLTSFFKTGKYEAFYAGVLYMLSGFMVGHVQSFTLIVATAWIPHVVVQYLKLLKSGSYRHLPSTALFMFLLITGGYQAFTIITGYLLLVLFTAELILFAKQKQWKSAIALLKINASLLFIVIALSVFIVVLLYQLMPYGNRISGGALEFANFNPLSPQCLISLLLPFAVVKEVDFFATDISMTNTYMGLTLLVFIVASFFRKKTSSEKIFLVFGIISLAASLGEYTPVRAFLFHYVPFFNLFRFPSIISYFTLFTFIPVAAKQLQLFHQNNTSVKAIKYTAYFIIGLLLVAFTYAGVNISVSQLSFKNILYDFYGTLANSKIEEHVFLQAAVQLLIFSCAVYFLLKNEKKLFLLAVVVEMVVATQLNIHYTGVSELKPKDIKEAVNQLPEGFPIPSMRPVERNTNHAAAVHGLNKNSNVLRKQISYYGFTSFWLKQYDELFAHHANLSKAVLKNSFAYFSSKVLPLSEYPLADTTYTFSQDIIYVNDSIYNKIIPYSLQVSPTDSIIPLLFTPSEIVFNTTNHSPVLFTLLQSNYCGWKLFVDGKPAEYFTSNYLFMSTLLPAGNHEVKFIYSNKPFVYALIASYVIAILLLLRLIERYYASNRAIGKWLLFGLIAVAGGIAALLIYRYGKNPQESNNKQTQLAIAEIKTSLLKYKSNDVTIIMAATNAFQVKKSLDEIPVQIYFYDCWDNIDKANLLNTIDNLQTHYLLFGWTNDIIDKDIEWLIKNKYPTKKQFWSNNNTGYILFSRDKTDETRFSVVNNFENGTLKYFDARPADTTIAYSGKNSILLGFKEEFSPAFTAPVGDISGNAQRCNVLVNARFYARNTEGCFLIFVIENGDKIKEWISIPLTEFVIKNNGWNRVVYVKELGWVEAGDRIKTYLWDRDKRGMAVDDFAVKVFEIQ